MFHNGFIQRPALPSRESIQEAVERDFHDSGIVALDRGLQSVRSSGALYGMGNIQEFEAKAGYQQEFDAHVEASQHDQLESAYIVDKWGRPYGGPQKIVNQVFARHMGAFNYTYISGATVTAPAPVSFYSSSQKNDFAFGKGFGYLTIHKQLSSIGFTWNTGSAVPTYSPTTANSITMNDQITSIGSTDPGAGPYYSQMNADVGGSADPANAVSSVAFINAFISRLMGGSNGQATKISQSLVTGAQDSVRCFGSGGLYGYVSRTASARPGNLTWTWQWSSAEAIGTWAALATWSYLFDASNRDIAAMTALVLPKDALGARATYTKTSGKSARITYGIQYRAHR